MVGFFNRFPGFDFDIACPGLDIADQDERHRLLLSQRRRCSRGGSRATGGMTGVGGAGNVLALVSSNEASISVQPSLPLAHIIF